MKPMFRDLKANEIDVRVNTVDEKGLTLYHIGCTLSSSF